MINDLYLEYIHNSYKLLIKDNPIKTWVTDQNRHSSKGDMQIASKHMKRCSTLVTKYMQMKATMKYHFIPTRTAIIKKSKTLLMRNSKTGENVEKLKPLYIDGGNVNGATAMENRWFLKTLSIYDIVIPPLGNESRDSKTTERIINKFGIYT